MIMDSKLTFDKDKVRTRCDLCFKSIYCDVACHRKGSDLLTNKDCICLCEECINKLLSCACNSHYVSIEILDKLCDSNTANFVLGNVNLDCVVICSSKTLKEKFGQWYVLQKLSK